MKKKRRHEKISIAAMIAPSNPAKPQKACLVTLLQYPYTYQNYERSLSTFGALRRCACHVASTARRRLPHPQQGYPQPNSNGDHSKGKQNFKQSRLRRVPYMLLCVIRQKMGRRVKKWRVAMGRAGCDHREKHQA